MHSILWLGRASTVVLSIRSALPLTQLLLTFPFQLSSMSQTGHRLLNYGMFIKIRLNNHLPHRNVMCSSTMHCELGRQQMIIFAVIYLFISCQTAQETVASDSFFFVPQTKKSENTEITMTQIRKNGKSSPLWNKS